MKEIVKIFALGGLDENGKNLYVVDVNDDLYIFDAGIRYPEESLLGIDIILPGINFLFENRRRHLFVQRTRQGDGERTVEFAPQPVYVLEVGR